jgi:large subunit ribosomal protein L25
VADVSLGVEVRTGKGKGVARQLRREGRIPAVLYGRGRGTTSITLNPTELDRLIRTSHAGVNTLIDLTGAGEVAGRTVIVKELQRAPVGGALLHADLYEIDLAERISVSVPIHLRGTAHGVTMGGLIDHALRVVELECLPTAIPDEILVDVSHLEVGHSIHVSDLVLPEGVELVTSGELSVVSVVAPRMEEEPVAEEVLIEGAPAEPVEGEEEGAGERGGERGAERGGESKES